ncbi:redox-regulated ATPase YchF, partial [Aeromonas schubertii]
TWRGIANLTSDRVDNPPFSAVFLKYPTAANSIVVPVCAAMEPAISHLEPDETLEFLADLGLTETGLDRVIN